MNSLPPLADSNDRLRRELQAVHRALADLAKQVETVQWRARQLAALRMGERAAADRMERLALVLDLPRVTTHVRDAIGRTELSEAPVPHLIVPDVLPPDVYEAAIAEIPSRVFFAPDGARQEIPVPPIAAPVSSIATWMFLADVMDSVVVPALVERLEEPLGRHARTLGPTLSGLRDEGIRLTVSRGRMVLRQPGDEGRVEGSGPWDWLTVVLHLARPEDSDDFGSIVRGSDAARVIPFRANTAVACVHPVTYQHEGIPAGAPGDTERYTCEFSVGPDKKTRRRLRR